MQPMPNTESSLSPINQVSLCPMVRKNVKRKKKGKEEKKRCGEGDIAPTRRLKSQKAHNLKNDLSKALIVSSNMVFIKIT